MSSRYELHATSGIGSHPTKKRARRSMSSTKKGSNDSTTNEGIAARGGRRTRSCSFRWHPARLIVEVDCMGLPSLVRTDRSTTPRNDTARRLSGSRSGRKCHVDRRSPRARTRPQCGEQRRGPARPPSARARNGEARTNAPRAMSRGAKIAERAQSRASALVLRRAPTQSHGKNSTDQSPPVSMISSHPSPSRSAPRSG